MPSKQLIEHLQQVLSKRYGSPLEACTFEPVSGGSINDCFRLQAANQKWFLKVNSAVTYPEMFQLEAKGLELLGNHFDLIVPKVYFHGQLEDEAYLLLEFLERGVQTANFWEEFGRALARMHRTSNSSFGLNYDNYIGSLPQSNHPHHTWADFFIKERLEVQLKRARDNRKVGDDITLRMERLFHRLDGLFPKEPPALLHGDLWSGNFSCGPNGKACIFDPAVYNGHREMDIAMSKLFGGFTPEFYNAYNEEWPLEAGWQQRADLANLYPLLVHVNLFGGGYLAQVRAILQRFI